MRLLLPSDDIIARRIVLASHRRHLSPKLIWWHLLWPLCSLVLSALAVRTGQTQTLWPTISNWMCSCRRTLDLRRKYSLSNWWNSAVSFRRRIGSMNRFQFRPSLYRRSVYLDQTAMNPLESISMLAILILAFESGSEESLLFRVLWCRLVDPGRVVLSDGKCIGLK